MRRLTILIFALLTAFGLQAQHSQPTSVDDINPFIGTGGHGHTHPSAQAPFGMMQLGPNTRLEGWDGCSGYHYTDSVLLGFSLTHLSGTGIGDYGDLLIGPSRADGAPLHMDKSSERASAGYYSVTLENGILLESTAGSRTGVLRLVFPEGHRAVLDIDLDHRDFELSTSFEALSDSSWQGHRYSRGWAQNQKLHFYFESNLPAQTAEIDSLHFTLDFGYVDTVELYIGMSGTDIDGAVKNFEAEDLAYDFAALRARTREEWAAELDKSYVYHRDADWRAIYATSLYHAYSVPNLWSDVDGRYRGLDDAIHTDTAFEHYTIFSLWDTYRTAHPLYAITQPERTQAFLNGFLDMYDQYGRLPIWELAANETNCMIGYHSVSVIADALAKGYPIDTARALEALHATATYDRSGVRLYMEKGFLSMEDESESVSKTLEYAYDDACISWAAYLLGDPKMAAEFNQRATAYRSLVDPETGWMRARDNGQFLADFNPSQVNNHYTEANSYQYSFAPVHDLDYWKGLLEQYLDAPSDNDALYGQLEKLFNAPRETTGRTQADITGLYGQYAHGNEPSHHIAYLYNSTDSVHKTQERVWSIMEQFYQNAPDGLSGNEDCGQMSAWFVMASWGLYPLVPGEARYAVSTPFWDRMEITLPNGTPLNAHVGGNGKYLKSWFTDQDLQATWIDHETLLKGGTWTVERSESPTSFGQGQPYRNSLENETAPAPIIDIPISINKKTVGQVVSPTYKSVAASASGSIQVKGSDRIAIGTGEIHATSPVEGFGAHESRAKVFWRDDRFEAHWESGVPNRQYTAGGPASMVDGIRGDVDWRKGHWVGIQGQNAELQLSANEKIKASEIQVSLLKDIRSWIAYPAAVTVSSQDRKGQWTTWERMAIEEPLGVDWSDEVEISELTFRAPNGALDCAVIKVEFENAGELLDWHLGAGGESFFFVDEVQVK